MLSSTQVVSKVVLTSARRWASSAANASKDKYKIVVVGAGTLGGVHAYAMSYTSRNHCMADL